ncbi:hypothetical protein OG244_03690 [Streptomyces brevispora]|uniref:hypothetical protein n=1 Tax=Streptomyces brevispora TaxID=887462 RepID=UPI002E2F3C7D|nr:hypothetical protein [Streptomyces brevispora]
MVILAFAAIFIVAGLAIRRNWWGVADELSGKHVSSKPLHHETSWGWSLARVFGGLFMAMGFLMILAFFYVVIRGWLE